MAARLAIFWMLGWILCGSAQATVVRLRAAAEPSGSLVLLGDVADVLDVDETQTVQLRRIELSPAPAEGESIWIDVVAVKDALARRGVRVGEVEFAGARRVEVKRTKAAPVKAAPPKAGPADWASVIEKMIRDHLLASTGWPDTEVSLIVDAARAVEFLEKNRPLHWNLDAPAEWTVGGQTVTLEVPDPRGQLRFPIQATVQRRRQAVIARRALQRGDIVAAADLAYGPAPVAPGKAPLFEGLEQAVGKEVKSAVAEGQPLTIDDLRGPKAVFRGAQVTVWVQHRTARLQMVMTAAEDGSVGDWIEVNHPIDRKKFPRKVRVIGEHTAELTPDAPQSQQNLAASPKRTASSKGPRP